MAQNYYWSKSALSFYPVAIKEVYVAASSFPADAVLVDDTVFTEYGGTAGAGGTTLGADASGMPTWVAGSAPTATTT